MHANCNRTTHGFAQLNIEYSILYYSISGQKKNKPCCSIYFDVFSFLLFFIFYFVQVSKQQLNENKTSRKSENEKSNYTAQ